MHSYLHQRSLPLPFIAQVRVGEEGTYSQHHLSTSLIDSQLPKPSIPVNHPAETHMITPIPVFCWGWMSTMKRGHTALPS